MKYCKNCGSQLEDNAQSCHVCGSPCAPINNTYNPSFRAPNMMEDTNYWAVAGFASSFFYPALGIILSAIGLHNLKNTSKGKGFAIAGLIISILLIIYNFITIFEKLMLL